MDGEVEEGSVAVGMGLSGEINLCFTRKLTDAKVPRSVGMDNHDEIFWSNEVKFF